MRKLFRILLYFVAFVLGIGCLLALTFGWSAWEVPVTVTTGIGGTIPLTLGKDGVSQMFFGFAGVLGVISLGVAISASRFLKDRT